jgi:WD40 repeat protein
MPSLALSGARDGVVRLWDGRSGTCVRSWAAHADAVQDLWVAPDGRTVFSGSEDGSVCITSVQ